MSLYCKSIKGVVSDYMYRILLRANDVYMKHLSDLVEYKHYYDCPETFRNIDCCDSDYSLEECYVEEHEFFYLSLLYAMVIEDGEFKEFYNSNGLSYSVLKNNVISIDYNNKSEVEKDIFDEKFVNNIVSYDILNKDCLDIVKDSWFKNYCLPSDTEYFCFPHNGSFSIAYNRFINALVEKISNSNNVIITNVNNKLDALDLNDDTNEEIKLPKKVENRYIKINCKGSDAGPIHLENLTAKEYDMNPLVGNKNALKNLAVTLCMSNHSALIIGPSGCGKTTLVDGLSYMIKTESIDAFKDYKIFSFNAADLVEGCQYVGTLEDKVNRLINYCLGKKVLLFIDEIHTLIGAGQGSKSNLDVANIFKPYLADGRLKIIGATTKEEYDEILKKDSAFNRRFGLVKLDEPNENELRNIVSSTFRRFINLYNIKLTFDEVKLEVIIEELCRVTSQRNNRVYNDMKYNPALVISIIERAFGNAIYDGSGLKISDICEAIQFEEGLYPVVRTNSVKRINAIKDNNIVEDEYEIRRRKITIS